MTAADDELDSRKRNAELEDKIDVLEFKLNALKTQLASHGIEPVIVG